MPRCGAFVTGLVALALALPPLTALADPAPADAYASRSGGAQQDGQGRVHGAPDGVADVLSDKPGADLVWARGFDGDPQGRRVLLVVRYWTETGLDAPRLRLSYHAGHGEGPTHFRFAPGPTAANELALDVTGDRAWSAQDLRSLSVMLKLMPDEPRPTEERIHVDAIWVRFAEPGSGGSGDDGSDDDGSGGGGGAPPPAPLVLSISHAPAHPSRGEPIRFAATLAEGTTATFAWDFGDGTTATGAEAQHAFPSSGTHAVRLSATTRDGRTGETTALVTVTNGAPIAAFSAALPADGTLGSVAFSDASVDPEGALVAWWWDFGDGATSAQRHPTHAYAGPGPYVARLTATDDEGAMSTTQRELRAENLAPSPGFGFGPDAPTTQDVVAFFDHSSDPDGAVVAWSWDFGDGATSSDERPTHRFLDDGEHVVRLTATDDRGARATVERTLRVANVAPSAGFVHARGPLGMGLHVSFTDVSTDLDGAILSWSWDFGDGHTLRCGADGCVASGAGTEGPGPAPRHVFPSAGLYEVRLEVADDDGATATATAEIRICPIVCLEVVMEKQRFGLTEDVVGNVSTDLPDVPFELTVRMEAVARDGTVAHVEDLRVATSTGSEGRMRFVLQPTLLIHRPAPGEIAPGLLAVQYVASADASGPWGEAQDRDRYSVWLPPQT